MAKVLKSILSTTDVDGHGDRMSLSALQGMAEQINSKWVPSGIEHDPRIPPVGRLLNAEISEREDGEHVLTGTIQLFEPGENFPIAADNRELALRWQPPGECEVGFDRTYGIYTPNSEVEELASALDATSKPGIKKAIEPVGVLTIAAGVALGSFLKSFFSKLGELTAESVANKIKKALDSRTDATSSECLLVLALSCELHGKPMLAEVIMVNPTEEELVGLLEQGLVSIDDFIATEIEPELQLRKVVLQFEGGQLRLAFGIRKDAYPVSAQIAPHAGGTDC